MSNLTVANSIAAHSSLANVPQSPSPLRGGVRGSGKFARPVFRRHPTPVPSPSRGGGFFVIATATGCSMVPSPLWGGVRGGGNTARVVVVRVGALFENQRMKDSFFEPGDFAPLANTGAGS